MNNPVLVTGASGFIGRAIVEALCHEAQPVRALVRRPAATKSLEAMGAETLVGDLLDPATADRAMAGVRGVFHLAGQLYTPGSSDEVYERLHVGATRALLQSRSSGQLDFFVLCSTTGVHGPTGDSPAREDDAGRPQNAYERTKADAERVAREVSAVRDLPVVIARPGLVYGPGDRHLLGWFRAIQGGYYRVIGTGTNRLHPIYIDDLVCGLMRCAAVAAAQSRRAYHLVGTAAVSIRDLSAAIGRAVGRPLPSGHLPTSLAYAVGLAFETMPVARRKLPLTRSRVRFLTQDRAYDGRRAQEELGFVPRVPLEEGLRRTVAWYRAQKLL